ncbi:MAG: hypothetical protein AAGE94_02870 [Acidobacteriota bacterium]
MTRSSWIVIATLSLASLGVLFFAEKPHTGPDRIELSSQTPLEPTNAIHGEVVEGPGGADELVIFATSLEPQLDELEVTMPGRDEPLRIARRDLELGTRIALPTATAESLRGRVRDIQATDGETTPTPGPWASRFEGKVLRLDQPTGMLRPQRPGLMPIEPADPRGGRSITWSVEVQSHRLADGGGFEVPVYAVATILGADGTIGYTQADAATTLTVRVDGKVLGELVVDRLRTRSEETLAVPLRRDGSVAVEVVAPDGAATQLALDWTTFGPQGLELIVLPGEGEAFSTPLSPLTFAIYARDEHGLLRPTGGLPILVDPPQGIDLEPATLRLEGEDPARLTARAHRAAQGDLVVSIPDLEISQRVPVHFRTPWTFLGVAAILGLIGVAVARRGQLLDQTKVALAFELLAAAAGGTLLYTAFLSQWLPAPGALLGELPAGAVGILGGYLGDGVFQVLAKRIGVVD